ncbi:SH3 domain-containing protein [Mesorhizobium sp. ORM8.1]
MRRKLTLRKTLLIAAPLLLAALPVVAEEAPGPIVSIVSGLAPDDLLNIRATASALGKTEARLPSGTSVKNYGCNTFDGYPWCKVEDLKNPNLIGWAPARYLTPNNPATVPEDQIAPAANVDPANAAPVEQTMIASVAATEPGTASRIPVSPAPQASVSPPTDLSARLGGGDRGKPVSAADIGKTAMQDAVGLAYAATDNPATSEIPCARYVGQPMTRCAVAVVRGDKGKAEVTIDWPDGGTRVISFNGGQPAGADSTGEFRFTREGSLNMIRVGVSERFEITDQLALGN